MATQCRSPRESYVLRLGGLICISFIAPAFAVGPSSRTADMPDSWLVLYNLNSPLSCAWASIYQQERGIPSQNMVGLNASLAEHLNTQAEAQDQIITPVRDLLINNPQLEQSIMGIILGFRLPGSYGSPPQIPNTGGFSIADALQDMTDDALAPANQRNDNADNPHFLGNILPPGGRLTKATMAANHYMVARMAAPDLPGVLDLTSKAKAIETSDYALNGENVSYDFYDPDFPAPSNEWFWLKAAVQSSQLVNIPWVEFDLDGQMGNVLPSQDAFRFSIYKLSGWSAVDFVEPNPASHVLAFQLNSFGAVTLRSTTDQGGLYVPNALAAGYAAAIGATGEPGTVVGPFPDTLLASLQQGWTLGEAYYLANPFNDWMWTLVGDPFLTMPHWFDAAPQPAPGDGDMNADGVVNAIDIALFVDTFLGSNTNAQQVAAADLDGNGVIDRDDAYLILGPLAFGSLNADGLKGTGDANADGLIDGQDIGAFVDILLNGTTGLPLQARWGADMNRDGFVRMDDIPSFVNTVLLQP